MDKEDTANTIPSQNTSVEKTTTPSGTTTAFMGMDIETALNHKIRLRQKMVRAEHHIKFLNKCQEEKQTGLRILKDIKLMESPGSHHTQATIKNIFLTAEQQVVKAPSEHHRKIRNDTEEKLNFVEPAIQEHLDKDGVAVSGTIGKGKKHPCELPGKKTKEKASSTDATYHSSYM